MRSLLISMGCVVGLAGCGERAAGWGSFDVVVDGGVPEDSSFDARDARPTPDVVDVASDRPNWDVPYDGPVECTTDLECGVKYENREEPNAVWRCCDGICESSFGCPSRTGGRGPLCGTTAYACDYRQGLVCCTSFGRAQCVRRGEGLCAGRE